MINQCSKSHLQAECRFAARNNCNLQTFIYAVVTLVVAIALSLAFTTGANAAITPEEDATGVQPGITRLASETSADTSLDIVKQTYAGGKTSDWVVIARDDDFADAMSATGLAGALNAPIILSNRESGLTNAAIAEIEMLQAKNAYIIGGAGAIPANIEAQLKGVGVDTKENSGGIRIFGENYWDTSFACASKVKQHSGDSASNDVIVAMGTNFQDALSISSFAYKYKVPIYLQTDDENGRTLTSMAQGAIASTVGAQGTIYVPGGPGAVSISSVEEVFDECKIQRIYGEDGFQTSNEIALWMVEHNKLNASTIAIANGAEGPKGTDALAGAALAGQAGGVILLANVNEACGTTSMATLEGSYIKGIKEKTAFLVDKQQSINQAYVLGGTTVMPTSVIDYAKTVLWKYNKVTFNTSGGTEVESQGVWAGAHAACPEDPKRAGHKFAGWYKDKALTQPFDFDNESIKTPTTVYAKWTDFRQSIEDQEIEVVGDVNLVYTGAEQKPTVVIKDTDIGSTLVEGTDYTLDYSNNKNAGEASITITGIGNYKGSKTHTFTIEKATIQTLSLQSASTVYNGSEQEPTVTIKIDSQATLEASDYTLTYTKQGDATFSGKPKSAGTYNVQVSANANGNFTGTATATWVIDRLNAEIKWGSTVFTYDGNAHVPRASVSNKVATDALEVEVSGKQTNAGQSYTATVTGLTGAAAENYEMPAQEQSTSFAINQATIKALTLQGMSTTYSASEQVPLIASIATDTTAIPDEGDYTLTYTKQGDASFSGKPKNVGTYTVEISGNAGTNFTGTATATWTIEKATPTVTFTSAGESASNPVVIYSDTTSSTQGISNFVSFAESLDETKLCPSYTVKNGDVSVEGTLTFTSGEGSTFTIKDVQETPVAYGVSFTPTGADASNYNEVKGTSQTQPATAPVIYVQVQQSSTFFLASTSLLSSIPSEINEIDDKNARANALAKQVNAAALKDSSKVFVSDTQLNADVKTMLDEQNSGKTANDAGTTLAKYKAYMNAAESEVHLFTTYGSSTDAWADATNAAGADANKYAEFRIVQVGEHTSASSELGDSSVLTFHAVHSLTSAYRLIEPDSGASGWGNCALRTQLQEGGSFYNNFPSAFTSSINNTTKAYATTQSSSASWSLDKFFLLAYSELCNNDSSYDATNAPAANLEGCQYDYYKTKNILGNANNISLANMNKTRAGSTPLNATSQNWWLRSPHMHDSGSFFDVNVDGNLSYTESSMRAISVTPAFCLGSDTTKGTTGADGSATIKNPTNNTEHKITVNYSQNEGEGTPLANAVVSFSESGTLTVVSPNETADGADILVTVQTADSANTPIDGVSVTVLNSSGGTIDTGLTTSSECEVLTGLSVGQFRAHNNVSWGSEQAYGYDCECTKYSYEKGSCAVCSSKEVTKMITLPKGHVKADGSSALSDYGKGGVAQYCSECSHVLLGSYYQTDTTGTQKDAIEWKILNDGESGATTKKLISVYGLDHQTFDPTTNNFASSAIRTWLNGTFYTTAFTPNEQSAIANTQLSDVDTTCKVYFLSSDEASNTNYFANDNERVCYVSAYAQNKGLNPREYWYTRTQSPTESNRIITIARNGEVDLSGHVCSWVGVTIRPVIDLQM